MGNATTKDKAKSYVGGATTNDSEVLFSKLRVDCSPTVSRSDGCDGFIGRKCDFVHPLKRYSNAALNGGCAREGSVATALDGKRTLRETRQ